MAKTRGFMEQIRIKNISLPNWSFKHHDQQQLQKLMASVKNNGQTKNLIVRQISADKYEVIDGKQVFKCLQHLDIDFVWCYVYRNVTDVQAMFLYLQNEFTSENDYIKIADAIKLINVYYKKATIEKCTRYNYFEILEMLDLCKFDFNKQFALKVNKQENLF